MINDKWASGWTSSHIVLICFLVSPSRSHISNNWRLINSNLGVLARAQPRPSRTTGPICHMLNLANMYVGLQNSSSNILRVHTLSHLIIIFSINNLNWPDRGWIGPQMSPCILWRNTGDSSLIFRRDGLAISFPFAHAVQMKSSGLGKPLTSWPAEFLMILLIMLNPGWPNRSCHIRNDSTLRNMVFIVTYPSVGFMYV